MIIENTAETGPTGGRMFDQRDMAIARLEGEVKALRELRETDQKSFARLETKVDSLGTTLRNAVLAGVSSGILLIANLAFMMYRAATGH